MMTGNAVYLGVPTKKTNREYISGSSEIVLICARTP
ncbi:hypothetical protein J2S21_001452 [Peribacillus cavernae]|nr:hypothetical protein [Peribacillus cavernae]